MKGARREAQAKMEGSETGGAWAGKDGEGRWRRRMGGDGAGEGRWRRARREVHGGDGVGREDGGERDGRCMGDRRRMGRWR